MFGRRCDMTAEEVCTSVSAKLSLMIAFLANAKPARVSYNRACTKVRVGLRFDGKAVMIDVAVEEMLTGDSDYKFMDKLFSRFGLSSEWARHKHDAGYKAQLEMKKELERRGGKAGFEALEEALYELHKSGVPQKKRAARRVQGDLARALSAVRRARKSGATVRQLNKLVRDVLGEEAVLEVQSS